MEITQDAPVQYQEFKLRQFFWQDSGQRYDEMTYRQVTETLAFMELERKHPHRQKKTD